MENAEFTPRLAAKVQTIPAPERSIVELIRRLDPFKVHEKEMAPRIGGDYSTSPTPSGGQSDAALTNLLPIDSKSPRSLFKDSVNVDPLPYRSVSVPTRYDGPMTEEGIAGSSPWSETYRRTEFIVLRAPDGGHAVIAADALYRAAFRTRSRMWRSSLPTPAIYVRIPRSIARKLVGARRLPVRKCNAGCTRRSSAKGDDRVNFIRHPTGSR